MFLYIYFVYFYIFTRYIWKIYGNMNKIYIRLLKIIIKKFLLFLECRIIQSGPDTRMLDPFRSNNIRTYVQAFQIKYLSNGKISIFRIFLNLSTSIIGLTYNFVLQLETISNFKSWRGHQNLRFLSRSVIQNSKWNI